MGIDPGENGLPSCSEIKIGRYSIFELSILFYFVAELFYGERGSCLGDNYFYKDFCHLFFGKIKYGDLKNCNFL